MFLEMSIVIIKEGAEFTTDVIIYRNNRTEAQFKKKLWPQNIYLIFDGTGQELSHFHMELECT